MKKLIPLSIILGVLLHIIGMAQTTSGYQVGDKVVDFQLKSVDGKTVSMAADPSAKGYILIFTSNTCPFSQAYEGRLMALHNLYAPKGYPVIAINSNDPVASPGDSFEKMQAQAKQKNYPFPYATDETQQIARTYGATRTPHVFIIQKQNADYVVKYTGTIDDNSQNPNDVTEKYAENALNQILAGKPVATSSTKAVGCTIKWKNS